MIQDTRFEAIVFFQYADLTGCRQSHAPFHFTQPGLGDSDLFTGFLNGQTALQSQASDFLSEFIHISFSLQITAKRGLLQMLQMLTVATGSGKKNFLFGLIY